MSWKNKVVGHTLEDPEQLLAHYANAREHDGRQRDTMRASLDRLGIIDSVKVNDRTGNLIDGHMRIEEYISKGIKEIPVEHVDLTEEEELEALAYYDAITTLGKYDPERLEGLLQQIDFENEPLENLLIDIQDLEKNIYENPKLAEDNTKGLYGIVINCKNETEQLDLLQKFLEDGLDCRTLNAS